MKKLSFIAITLLVLSLSACHFYFTPFNKRAIACVKDTQMSTGQRFEDYIDADIKSYADSGLQVNKIWQVEEITKETPEGLKVGRGEWNVRCKLNLSTHEGKQTLSLEYGVQVFSACGKPIVIEKSFYKVDSSGKRLVLDE